jgi:hypothetical protein
MPPGGRLLRRPAHPRHAQPRQPAARGRGHQGGGADLAAGQPRSHRQQLGADRGAPPDRGHKRAAGPRRGGLVHRPRPLRAPDDRPHPRPRGLPGPGTRDRGAGPLSATGRSIPGARSWAEIDAAANGALVGVDRHLALPLSPELPDAQVEPERDGGAPLVAGYRLRLAVITAARHADVPTATALIRESQRQGLDAAWLLAVAARHWPPPSLHVRVWRAGRRWAASGARWAWARRPHRQAGALLDRGSRP